MSKAGQVAQDLRNREAANEQLRSEIQELAPESGTQEAEAVRGKIQTLPQASEAKELPSFEDALDACAQVTQGDNAAADVLSHKYGSRAVKFIKRIPTAPDGGLGWHVEGRDDGPLTPEQSKQLAVAINDRIDIEKMKKDAEANRAKREKQKENKVEEQPAAEPAAESIDPTGVMEGMVLAISELTDVADLKKLRNIALDADRMGLVRKTDTGVAPIKDLKGSHELAQAINSKRKELLNKKEEQEQEAEEKQRTERRIEGFKRTIDTITDNLELESFVYRKMERESHFLKKINLKNREWTVEAIEGKYGSKELVGIVLARKDALKKAEADKKETLKKAEEEKVKAKRQQAIAVLGDKYRIVKR